jgi:hypothetical protein
MRVLRLLCLALLLLLGAEAAVRILEATGILSRAAREDGPENELLVPGIIAHPHLVHARDPSAEGALASFCRGNVPGPARTGSFRIALLGVSPCEATVAPDVGTLLQDSTEDTIEILDCRTPLWTSAEALAHYCLVVQDYSPDVVVLDTGAEDLRPRALPGFVSSTAHFRKIEREAPEKGALESMLGWSRLGRRLTPAPHPPAHASLRELVERDPQGIDARLARREPLPEETSAAFHRNIVTLAELVRSAGGVPVLVATAAPESSGQGTALLAGLAEQAALTRRACAETGALLVDLADHLGPSSRPLDPFTLDAVTAIARERALASGILALEVLP